MAYSGGLYRATLITIWPYARGSGPARHRGSGDVAPRPRRALLRRVRASDPHCDRYRLHRLRRYVDQLLRDLIQRNLVAEAVREPVHLLLGVIAAAIEPAIDCGLDSATQRSEHGGNGEGRHGDQKWRLVGQAKNSREGNGYGGKHGPQGTHQQGVGHRTTDDSIDLEQPVAQNGDREARGEQRHSDEDAIPGAIARVPGPHGDGDQDVGKRKSDGCDHHGEGEDDPAELGAFETGGAAPTDNK